MSRSLNPGRWTILGDWRPSASVRLHRIARDVSGIDSLALSGATVVITVP